MMRMSQTMILMFATVTVLFPALEGPSGRNKGARKRTRDVELAHFNRFTDIEIKEQTSLDRDDFKYILSLILPELALTKRQEQNGINANGSCILIVLKLFIAMRLLKGAKKHDLTWMGTDAYLQAWRAILISWQNCQRKLYL